MQSWQFLLLNIYCKYRSIRNEAENGPFKNVLVYGGSPGLVVMGGDLCSKGRAFESQHYLLDGHIFTFIYCKNSSVC